ncbi:hypothetical protein TNCV_2166841 [Trichonephila clavipes]|nr:hypothetical protein TNCV_2166841 [Trichonephila clavipes]
MILKRRHLYHFTISHPLIISLRNLMKFRIPSFSCDIENTQNHIGMQGRKCRRFELWRCNVASLAEFTRSMHVKDDVWRAELWPPDDGHQPLLGEGSEKPVHCSPAPVKRKRPQDYLARLLDLTDGCKRIKKTVALIIDEVGRQRRNGLADPHQHLN